MLHVPTVALIKETQLISRILPQLNRMLSTFGLPRKEIIMQMETQRRLKEQLRKIQTTTKSRRRVVSPYLNKLPMKSCSQKNIAWVTTSLEIRLDKVHMLWFILECIENWIKRSHSRSMRKKRSKTSRGKSRCGARFDSWSDSHIQTSLNFTKLSKPRIRLCSFSSMFQVVVHMASSRANRSGEWLRTMQEGSTDSWWMPCNTYIANV